MGIAGSGPWHVLTWLGHDAPDIWSNIIMGIYVKHQKGSVLGVKLCVALFEISDPLERRMCLHIVLYRMNYATGLEFTAM